jgi:hypothetical protein
MGRTADASPVPIAVNARFLAAAGRLGRRRCFGATAQIGRMVDVAIATEPFTELLAGPSIKITPKL